MLRFVVCAIWAFALLVGSTFVSVTPTAAAANCEFVRGFKALHDLIPDRVGDCKANSYRNPQNGDELQETVAWHGRGGLLVFRGSDNSTAFTDGTTTWLNGPNGLQSRPNGARFAWEHDPASAARTVAPSATVPAAPSTGEVATAARPAAPVTDAAQTAASVPPASAASTAATASSVAMGRIRVVGANGANLRAQPNSQSALVSWAAQGSRVEILEQTRGEAIDPVEARWWHIRYQGVDGYAYYKLVVPD